MSRPNELFFLLTIIAVGIWGCAQAGPSQGASTADRLKALEIKSSKLEEDFRAVAAVRDQLRRKLAAAEEQQQQLQRQAEEQQKTFSRQRDEFRRQLAARTTERDALVTQLEQFRKNLKDLLGQVEASLPRAGDPVSSAVEVVDPDRS